MRNIRTLAPGAAALALIIMLAACGQTPSTQLPSEQPSAPAPSTPTESDSPSEAPSETPDSSPIDVVEHDLPIIARVTEDGVEVRTEPRTDAPIATAEDLSGSGEQPEVVLDSDALVVVTLGPVFADDESWYEVAAADGGELQFAFGWVPGDLIEPTENEPPGFAPYHAIHGQGEGDEVSAEVMSGTPVTVRFAATTMPDDDECEIDVTLVRTDGTAVNVATDRMTDRVIFELGPTDLGSLFQEEAGTVTLQVETDCSFAAVMITP